METNPDVGSRVPGVFHGGFGRFSLQECLDRLNQAKVDAPAPCHSGVDNENPSNAPQEGSRGYGSASLLEVLNTEDSAFQGALENSATKNGDLWIEGNGGTYSAC